MHEFECKLFKPRSAEMAAQTYTTKAARITGQISQKRKAAKCANPNYYPTIRSVVEDTLKIERAMSEMRRARQGVPRSWPGARFTARAVAEAVRPIVEEIRLRAFGSTAPFDSAEAFEEWARPHLGAAKTAWARFEEDELSYRTPYRVLLEDVRTKLVPLTGWTEGFALAHVAIGSTYPGGFVSTAHHSHGAPPWVQVTFYPWHVNDVYLEHLRSALGKLLRTRWAKRSAGWGEAYSTDDLMLLDLLAHVGPPPWGQGKGKAVGRTEYWKRLSAAWGKWYKERVEPNALRMRWERFVDTHPEDERILLGWSGEGDGTSPNGAPSP